MGVFKELGGRSGGRWKNGGKAHTLEEDVTNSVICYRDFK